MIERIFIFIVKFRVAVLILGLLGVVVAASYLPKLNRDTSADAFIPDDNPALIYREQVKETFGLADPIVIAIFNETGSIFTPENLQIIESLTLSVQNMNNIDPDRVVSLATEKNIQGTSDGMEVERFFDNYPDTLEKALLMQKKIENFPLYQGSLVAKDGSASLIVAEVFDEKLAEQTYLKVMALIRQTQLPEGVTIHVAGEAAVTGYLGMYIDSDAQRLNPIAGLIITIILFLAFRTFAGALMPNIIVASTVLGTMGLMIAAEVSFFVITNAMPVVLIGIAVADSIHIFSAYYETINTNPGTRNDRAVIGAMLEMARPITLTSLTTIAGFLGLYISSVQPPMQYLGLFTALGVGLAWLYSMTVLPACMSFLKVKENALFKKKSGNDWMVAALLRLGHLVVRYPEKVVLVSVVLVGVGIVGASNIKVDERRIDTFHKSEAVYRADKAINEKFDGTSVFDIVVETEAPEALFRPEYLKKIEAFQAFIEKQDNVGGSTSVVDYLKQINKSINEGREEEYRLVDDELLNAQLFLLYSTSGDPTDFEEEIDYDYQKANIRVNLTSSSYQELVPLVEKFNHYILTEFNEPGLSATVSGRAMITYEWVDAVGSSHFKSVFVSLALVLMMAAIVFRSLTAGLMSLAPVAVSILCVYAVMVSLDIHLGIGTSMFASVAIGLGVDFAIHTLDRIRIIYREGDGNPELMLDLFPSTGRALFFNLLALAFGFGVLVTSDVVPLMRFGGIVALSLTTSFLCSLTFLPALILWLKPAFVFRQETRIPMLSASLNTILAVILISVALLPDQSFAEELSGIEVMSNVAARNDGEHVTRNLTMKLIDRRGKRRVRVTKSFRKYYSEEKRTVLFYTSPSNLKDTAFLTWDYKDTDIDDDQWLYLPAARKIRRISASDRGDYFLGTDFSYEDIKNENKPALADYTYKHIGNEVLDGIELIVVEGIPVNDEIGRELGYGRIESYVDPKNWMIRQSLFWDIRGNPLKKVQSKEISKVDEIWTSHKILSENFKTGHKTEFTFSDIDYRSEVKDSWFESRQLRRGL
ncbi:MAG: hydrophobe/amphiphile efflux-3 (HAE3) family protein [Candidatus Azotimanducaceae bacterium]|jgi:hydrophobe/amphiphile efflux-3 (HAE3) family protein